jgi:TonB family protein
MKRNSFLFALVALFLSRSIALSQDCDGLIQQRPVPEANAFIYATPYYTMGGQNGSVTFNALTADGAIAIIFLIGDQREKCLDERSSVQIRFTDGQDVAMTNTAGANCDGRFAMYFSAGLGNMALLELFRNKKIRFLKFWLSNGRWVRINFVDGMSYNLRKSLNCLTELIDAPVTASPAMPLALFEPKDSIGVSEKTFPPQFEGGDKALKRFLGRHMRRRSIVDRGTVLVSFMVDTEGNVRDPKVMRGVSETVDNEARRLVSTLPKWKPAMQNGTPVRAYVNVEIAF